MSFGFISLKLQRTGILCAGLLVFSVGVFAVMSAQAQSKAAGSGLQASHTYTPDEMRDMLYGLSFLGSGGGGAFKDGEMLLGEILDTSPQGVTIQHASQIKDTDRFAVSGGIGAPAALKGKIPEVVVAINKTLELVSPSAPVTSLLSVESGPANAFISVLLNLNRKSPVFDGDGAGRSVPSLTNLSYNNQPVYTIIPAAIAALPATPGGQSPAHRLFADPKESTTQLEEDIRTTLQNDSRYNEVAGLTFGVQTGAQMKAAPFVSGTFALAAEIGKVMRQNETDFAVTISKLIPVLNGMNRSMLYAGLGTLTSYTIQTVGGFDIGVLQAELINPLDTSIRFQAKISAKNENLLSELTYAGDTASGFSFTPGTITAPALASYFIKVPATGKFVPLNNGDNLKQYIGQTIGVVWSAPNLRLYETQNGWLQSFEDQLKTIEYSGPVCPNPNQSDPWSGCAASVQK